MARKAKRFSRFQYLGWIIEQGAAGWYVIDWDYEGDGDVFYRAPNKYAAMAWIDRRETNPFD